MTRIGDPSQVNTTTRILRLILLGLYVSLVVAAIVLFAGISDQATYGKQKICLLNISNYRLDQPTNSYVFDADSPECGVVVGFGVVLMLIALGLGLTTCFSNYAGRTPKMIAVYVGVALLGASVALVAASLSTAGTNASCQLMKAANVGQVSCSTIFSNGFYGENGDTQRYSKNLNVVVAAAGGGWFCFVGWSLIAGYEYFNYRKATCAKAW